MISNVSRRDDLFAYLPYLRYFNVVAASCCTFAIRLASATPYPESVRSIIRLAYTASNSEEVKILERLKPDDIYKIRLATLSFSSGENKQIEEYGWAVLQRVAKVLDQGAKSEGTTNETKKVDKREVFLKELKMFSSGLRSMDHDPDIMGSTATFLRKVAEYIDDARGKISSQVLNSSPPLFTFLLPESPTAFQTDADFIIAAHQLRQSGDQLRKSGIDLQKIDFDNMEEVLENNFYQLQVVSSYTFFLSMNFNAETLSYLQNLRVGAWWQHVDQIKIASNGPKQISLQAHDKQNQKWTTFLNIVDTDTADRMPSPEILLGTDSLEIYLKALARAVEDHQEQRQFADGDSGTMSLRIPVEISSQRLHSWIDKLGKIATVKSGLLRSGFSAELKSSAELLKSQLEQILTRNIDSCEAKTTPTVFAVSDSADAPPPPPPYSAAAGFLVPRTSDDLTVALKERDQ